MSIHPRALLRALVALATVGLASSALAATAGAGTASSKPTIVLVHGAFADSSGFTGVIDQLRRDGYPVRAAPNRLLGLQSDAATVRGFLDSIKGPKILVGHSYGGAVSRSRRDACFPPCVSLHLFRSLGFSRERNRPPPAFGCFLGFPPGLLEEGGSAASRRTPLPRQSR
jgi:Alpha/beta hydrolase family